MTGVTRQAGEAREGRLLARAWARVESEAARLRAIHLRALFAADPDRFERLSFPLGDLLVDFSKEKLDAAALYALVDLARVGGVAAWRNAMFAGQEVNLSEHRAALHMALREGAGARLVLGGRDIMPEVRATLGRFLAFAEEVRTGRAASASGAPFEDVLVLGIGGSILGPRMAALALAPFHDGPRLHFVSNVDGFAIDAALRRLDPARTLVIVISKSFTTLETMTNAATAREWLARALGEKAGAHMAAVSTNLVRTRAFGIDDSRVFGFWDWVGGRFSVWSAVGLPLAIAIGAAHFRRFLFGASEIDVHFRRAPLEENLPVLMGLVGVWRRNAMGWPTVGVMPYDQRLARFPTWLQQVAMESNGKGVDILGRPVARATAPVVWGMTGTDCQHSVFQLLHQGTEVVPLDFLVAAEPAREVGEHHVQLVANALAQSAALAFGRAEAEVRAEMEAAGFPRETIDLLAPQRASPGDRPSTTILFRRLDPAMLGRLMALYEHKTAVEGALWNVNSFDQWGVELGKTLAARLAPAVRGQPPPADTDASTRGLLAHFHELRRLDE